MRQALILLAASCFLGLVAGKAGVCPNPQERSPGICLSTCDSDDKCAGYLKCCPNSCGEFTCAMPNKISYQDYPKEKPGKCPPVTRNGFCNSNCASDQQCSGSLKCCTNKCGASTCAFPQREQPTATPEQPTFFSQAQPSFSEQPYKQQQPYFYQNPSAFNKPYFKQPAFIYKPVNALY